MRVLSLAIAILLQIAPLTSAAPIEYAQAATTPLRKRSQVQRKSNRQQRRQKGEDNHQANLGLSHHGRHLAGHDGDHSMSHSLSTPTSTPSSCTFCPAGVTAEPDYELPTDDDATCETAKAFAATLDPTDVMCSTVKLAQVLCCPPVDLPVTTAAVEPCTFCPGGLTVEPDFQLPTNDGATCGTAMGFAATLSSSDAMCPTVKLAQALCCPPVNLPEPTEDAATAPPSELCSCSPREYNIKLNLDQDCDVDDLDGAPGIDLTFCFLGSYGSLSFGKRFVRRLGQGFSGNSDRQLATRHIEFEIEDFTRIKERELAGDDVEIISIQFLEFDTSGGLIVINQDDTYSNTTLKNGDVATFKSISDNLDPDVPIEDQLDILPGGVQLTLRGRTIDEVTGEEKIVSNRITWSYTNACGVEPLEAGQSIGWTTFGELEPASEAFCPAPVTTTTTTTTPTTTTTEEETTTKAPETTTKAPETTTKAPETTTEAPETTTEAPETTMEATEALETTTEAPIVTTEAPTTTKAPATTTEATPATTTPAMSMHSKSSKALFGKSSKGGVKSKTYKESPMPKAQKTPKNPMAKVTKESDLHDEKQSHDDAVDSKSGKALVDLDAKAEKLSKASKAVIVSGKASKKESSKAEKKASSNGSKSGKGSKMEKAPLIPGSKFIVPAGGL